MIDTLDNSKWMVDVITANFHPNSQRDNIGYDLLSIDLTIHFDYEFDKCATRQVKPSDTETMEIDGNPALCPSLFNLIIS